MMPAHSLELKPLGDEIVQLTMDMPEKAANVITAEFQDELEACLGRIEAWDSLRGLVLVSAKPNIFVAGADLVAISKTLNFNQQQVIDFCRRGQSLFDRLGRLPLVVVAAIGGVCVGGGLELALACDGRLVSADGKAMLGLPEVKLGLIPGWGGTARLPRLVGLDNACDLITTGKLISSRESVEIGLADAECPPNELVASAVQWIRAHDFQRDVQPRRQELSGPVSGTFQTSQLRSRFTKSIETHFSKHALASQTALSQLLDSASDTLAEASEKEAVAMSLVYGSDANAGLLNTFFLGELAKKLSRSADRKRAPTAIGIVGIGLMGGEIASIIPEGQAVLLLDQRPGRAQEVADQCNAASKSSRFQVAQSFEEFASCQLVIESVTESLPAKSQLLRQIEGAVGEDVLLATNSSVICVSEIAAELQRPQNVCGLHFCLPVRQRPLVELIRGAKTADRTMQIATAWISVLKKTPLEVADIPGFVVNRILCPMFNEAAHLLSPNCSATRIDQAMREFGFEFGPLEFMDRIGIDILHAAGRWLIPRLTTPTEPSLLLHALHRMGALGRKSSSGFYQYGPEGQLLGENEALSRLIAEYSQPDSAAPTAAEIRRRLLLTMVNQAADVLAEGGVSSAAEIDLAMIQGGGFPEQQGGILFWAQRRGFSRVRDDFRLLASDRRLAPRFQLSKGLEALVRDSQQLYA